MTKIRAKIKAVAEVELWVTIHEDAVGNQEIVDIDDVGEIRDISEFEIISVID